jgi:hypothetical protein
MAQVGPPLRVMKADPPGRRSTGQGIIGTIIVSGMQKIQGSKRGDYLKTSGVINRVCGLEGLGRMLIAMTWLGGGVRTPKIKGKAGRCGEFLSVSKNGIPLAVAAGKNKPAQKKHQRQAFKEASGD